MPNDNTRLTEYETKEKLDELDKVRAENRKQAIEYDPLEPQLDYDNKGVSPYECSDHWPECWRVHLECAIRTIESLKREIDDLAKEYDRMMDANVNEGLDY